MDLENLAHDNRSHLGAAATETLTCLLDPLFVGWPVTVAVQGHLVARYLPTLASRSWRVLVVASVPDAADHALLNAGQDYVLAGVTDLVVVSGDRCFADLAPLARLHVITRADRLSRSLRMAATTTTLLDPADGSLRTTSAGACCSKAEMGAARA